MSSDVLRALKALASLEKAAFFPKFFKTGKGQYGEGDVFIGVTVPQMRSVAKQFRDLPMEEVEELLENPIHEARAVALFILVSQYERGDDKAKKEIVDFYLAHLDRVNNWDLVDLSAYKILGDYLLTHDRAILMALAKSKHLWRERVAMVSTYAFIKAGEFDDTLWLAQYFLPHTHDLMHKAAGWMLREMGKKNPEVLRAFLHKYSRMMPRTMLRYAIEKFPETERQQWMRK